MIGAEWILFLPAARGRVSVSYGDGRPHQDMELGRCALKEVEKEGIL